MEFINLFFKTKKIKNKQLINQVIKSPNKLKKDLKHQVRTSIRLNKIAAIRKLKTVQKIELITKILHHWRTSLLCRLRIEKNRLLLILLKLAIFKLMFQNLIAYHKHPSISARKYLHKEYKNKALRLIIQKSFQML